MVTVEELANFIVDPDECDIRLHLSSFTNDVNLLHELLQDEECRQTIDFKTRPFGATPLRLAATSGATECMKLLLAYGAKVDESDYKAQTPLYVAIKNHLHLPAKLLLEHGANPNGNDRNSCTPLYLACQSGFLEGVQMLLNSGALTESFDRLTAGVPGHPLRVALLYQHLSCFLALLMGGAETDLTRIKPALPISVIQRLSLPHAMVQYRVSKSFLEFFYLFGGNLWQRNSKDQLATELTEECEVKGYLAELMNHPLSLLNSCRILIRRTMGRQNLCHLNSLPLPSQMLKYLQCERFITN